ncbi:MAG: methionyl-tRNA formyltransferase [Spirochaetales bacterium]|nr:methionyl-tRNA formyltransferase [Spirochaetales bacterium]
MRLLFAGTPRFAVPSLETLAKEHDICAVLTAPDRQAGRGNKVIPSAVKQSAEALGLPLYQPEKLDDEFIAEIKALKAELLAVAAYGVIFKEKFLNIFPRGGINLHPSLLPKYRGPSPIPAVILAGERETGVTIQTLALKMDAGDILAQERYPLAGGETTVDLSQTLSEQGAQLLLSAVNAIQNGTAEARPQRAEEVSFCKLVRKEHGRIDWRKEADYISRMIRAYYPWPGVYTTFKDKKLFFLQGFTYKERVFKSGHTPGEVLGVDKQCGILINTNNGILCIKELQVEFKKPSAWKDFLNGHKDFIGAKLGG